MTTAGQVSRRRFARLGALGVAGLSVGSVAPAAAEPGELRAELLCALALDLDWSHHDSRRPLPVRGGSFRGPALTGTVVGGGAWRVARPDGREEINLQATLRTGDGQSISIRSRGIVDWQEVGLNNTRATPILETASPRYAWLNHLVAVAVGRTHRTRAAYRIFRIS